MNADAADAAAVDHSVLDALAARLGDRGPTFRTSLVATWRTEAAARRAELQLLGPSGDADGVARIAHTMRSSAGSLGARPLAALCGKVEDDLRAGRPVDVADAAARITAELDRADAAFVAHSADGTGSEVDGTTAG